MCTDTFLRLPEEKRNRFLEAAWAEFTSVPFEEASINQIVHRARIPRGSFYQYFSDKEDLFFYLQSSMMRHFLEEYRKILMQYDGDFFQTQLWCFDRVTRREVTDPLFLRGVEILRLNPVLLLRVIGEERLALLMWEVVREQADAASFQDPEQAREAFILSLTAMVMNVTDAMARPQQAESCRRELLIRLDILKRGSAKRGER